MTSAMSLRKCPRCHEIVGAESTVCPRCGVGFRWASIQRVIRWTVIVVLAVWIVCHYFFKVM